MERQEQYSRRNYILIHGSKEEKNVSAYDRVLKLFREGMNEDVLLADLDRTHRLGGKKSLSSKPRSVIAKLARYNTREKVSKSQKNSKEKTLASQKVLPNEFFKITVLITGNEPLVLKIFNNKTDIYFCIISKLPFFLLRAVIYYFIVEFSELHLPPKISFIDLFLSLSCQL